MKALTRVRLFYYFVEVYCVCVLLYVLVVSGGWYSSCSDTRSLFTRQTKELILAKPLPPTLHVQFDYCAKDNKCLIYVLYLVVAHGKRHFQIGVGNFLLWWGTRTTTLMHHSASRAWSCMKMIPTISLLKKSYMNLDNVPVILHMIEEIPNSKAFIKPYMLKAWTVWSNKPKHNNSASTWGMMVSLSCNSSFYAHHLIKAEMMVYSCGVKTRMESVCS